MTSTTLRTLFVLVALLFAVPASAASILAWDVGTLTERSTLVVEARVDAVRSEVRNGDIRTVNTLTVLDTLKGSAASTLQVVQGSGRVGDLVKTIHGDMELAVGERYVLFLSRRDVELHSTLLGWSVFHIDGTGDDAPLQRNLAGLALFSRADDGSLSEATELDLAAATPRTLGELRREVRASR
jgi:hypothetical protein